MFGVTLLPGANMNRKLFSLLISILLFHFSLGQSKHDTTFVFNAVAHTREIYTQGIGAQTHLHNGVEHRHYRDEVELEAYLEPEWVIGSIFYDNELFENVPLMYDMIGQRVVTYFAGQVDLDLITEKVDWFMIGRRKFVYLGRDKNDASIDPAFYELLDNGTVKLYARRRKRIDQKIGEKVISYDVIASNHYFLLKEGEYIAVNTKRALVGALGDKKKELKQFKKENKIHFDKEHREIAIRKFVAHYNKLR